MKVLKGDDVNVFGDNSYRPLDGYGCGVVAKVMLDEPVDVKYINNNEVNKTLRDALDKKDLYTKIFVTDLHPENEEFMDNLTPYETRKLRLFDHHISAIGYNKYTSCLIQPTKNDKLTSGTELFYDYLNKEITQKYKSDLNYTINFDEARLRYFVELVTRYDSWRWKNERDTEEDIFLGDEGKKLNDLFHLINKEEFTNSMYDSIMNNRTFFPNRYVRLLEEEASRRNEYIEDKMKHMLKTQLQLDENYTVGFVVAEKYTSELGSTICEKDPEIDFVAILTGGSVSMRSVKDVDVSVIAKKMGGGGHKHAGGFPLNKQKLLGLLFEM